MKEFMRPMNEQVCVAKNMFKSFGSLFKNTPDYVEELRECALVIGEYEIRWLKQAPVEFYVSAGMLTKGSHWDEPDDLDIVELASFDTLYEAVRFIALHNVDQVFGEYMEGEQEFAMDKEMEDADRRYVEIMYGQRQIA